MDDTIARLVQIAGAALESEDRYILGAMHANHGVYAGPKCGILRRDFREAYYQYIVARALMSSFPYVVGLEEGNRNDLVLRHPGDDSRKPFAVIEMKQWWEEGSVGEMEIQKIQRDVEEKLTGCDADWGLMMVFTANLTAGERGMLSRRLGVRSASVYSYTFPTFNVPGDQADFWLLVLVVKSPTE